MGSLIGVPFSEFFNSSSGAAAASFFCSNPRRSSVGCARCQRHRGDTATQHNRSSTYLPVLVGVALNLGPRGARSGVVRHVLKAAIEGDSAPNERLLCGTDVGHGGLVGLLSSARQAGDGTNVQETGGRVRGCLVGALPLHRRHPEPWVSIASADTPKPLNRNSLNVERKKMKEERALARSVRMRWAMIDAAAYPLGGGLAA